MTLKYNTTYTQALIGAGLSTDQACLYQLLLGAGSLPAGRIPRFMNISRPQAYKLLNELVGLGVATKDVSPGKPARYVPAHPFAVQELLRKRKEELDIAAATMEGVMGSLISEYTTASRLPGFRIIAGTEGLRELYKDILQEGVNIQLIRSTRDDDTPERMTLVLETIKKQVEHGIHARIIGPLPTDVTPEELKKRDASRLTERRVLPREQFELPAQIIVYNDKVGITAYNEPIITTIVENGAIADSMHAIFEVMWSVGKEVY